MAAGKPVSTSIYKPGMDRLTEVVIRCILLANLGQKGARVLSHSFQFVQHLLRSFVQFFLSNFFFTWPICFCSF